jgi:proteic killer suppression protein
MIVSVKDKRLLMLLAGQTPKRFPAAIADAVDRRMTSLILAARVEDLRVPPGHRLEALKGDRAGQYSIRVNDQWRICFRWEEDGAHDVELVDYH